MGKEIFTNDKYINDLFLKVVNLVTQARERVATAVNIAEVYTKFHIGRKHSASCVFLSKL